MTMKVIKAEDAKMVARIPITDRRSRALMDVQLDSYAFDAVPVVHGRWITYPECLGYDGAYHDEHIVCSACHSVWNIIDNCTDQFDYCPTCGAKMDGGADEHGEAAED